MCIRDRHHRFSYAKSPDVVADQEHAHYEERSPVSSQLTHEMPAHKKTTVPRPMQTTLEQQCKLIAIHITMYAMCTTTYVELYKQEMLKLCSGQKHRTTTTKLSEVFCTTSLYLVTKN